MRRFTKALLAGVLAVGMVAGFLAAWGYELPEVIVRIEGEQPPEGAEPAPYRFGTDFCCVGDVNGDGYDDLLVNHAPFETGYGDAVFPNQVELYYGGNPMDDEPDFAFTTDDTTIGMGYSAQYVGRIDESGETYAAIQVRTYANRFDSWYGREVWLYQISGDLENEPRYRLSLGYREQGLNVGYSIGPGRTNRPCDLNGDGYNDVIATKYAGDPPQMAIFRGGGDFEGIPDLAVNSDALSWLKAKYCSGYDVNNDGYDDILIEGLNYNSGEIWHYLFLGGNPMDSIPAFHFSSDEYQGKEVRYGFSLLPDVNGDGYDDMGFNYYIVPRERWDEDGALVFFGSDEPDKVPDLDLEGHTNPFSLQGEIAGGDFNGDGVGDIIFINPLGNQLEGEINFFFGSPWIDEEADFVINSSDVFDLPYFGNHAGGVGDYNGDGIRDFVCQSWTARDPATVVILAGNHDWEVSTPYVKRDARALSLTINPNPFNSLTSIRYDLPSTGSVDLAIYDLGGRKVASLKNGGVVSDQGGSLEWASDKSGIYFAVLRFTNWSGAVQIRISKLVCIR